MPSFFIGVALLLIGMALYSLYTELRRRRSAHLATEAFAIDRGLGSSDLRFLRSMAREWNVEPSDLMTRPETFERTTAAALHAKSLDGDRAFFDRIRAIRVALGFDRIPPLAQMYSTRELSIGTRAMHSEIEGHVTHVTEYAFTVQLTAPLRASTGELVNISVQQASAPKYDCLCKLLSINPVGENGSHVAEFSHDERPQNRQQREYARVSPDWAKIVLRSPDMASTSLSDENEVTARLVDVSGGGARVATRSEIAVEQQFLASFTVELQPFRDIAATVLSVSQSEGGLYTANLAFREMDPRERDRLVSAVIQLDLRQHAIRRGTA